MAPLSSLLPARHDVSLATPAARSTRARRPADLGSAAEAVLEEVAYVLHLTRRVKNAVLESRVAEVSAN